MSSTLEELPDGADVFVDSTIFVYHFTGASTSCRAFLERCERGRLRAFTSVLVLAEVTHRLMMLEAVGRGLLTPGNVARRLRERPDLVRGLGRYQDQVERIPLMRIEVLSLDLTTVLRSSDLRARYGLLANDSLIAATALQRTVPSVASADRDFDRVGELRLYAPGDLSPVAPA